jgi:hypothetical protein
MAFGARCLAQRFEPGGQLVENLIDTNRRIVFHIRFPRLGLRAVGE